MTVEPFPALSTAEDCRAFHQQVITWQKRAGRHDLPWQNTQDPYRIWLSEIMLQQTQVSAVIPYYQRFLERFPDVAALAAAPSTAVMAAWAGLGYYARARNLHACAQRVCAEWGGQFPVASAELVQLPGIGRSTAAAIAAFAAGERAAILDGNVKRVLCRYFAIEGFPGGLAIERPLWALAEALLPETDLAAYTQGLMDLGATICTRHRPVCAECPLKSGCQARAAGRQAELPTARPKKALPKRSSAFVLAWQGDALLLAQRPPKGIWGGLLVPPECSAAALAALPGWQLEDCVPLLPLMHRFTHYELTLLATSCSVLAQGELPADWHWVPRSRLADSALPTPIRKLLRQAASSRD